MVRGNLCNSNSLQIIIIFKLHIMSRYDLIKYKTTLSVSTSHCAEVTIRCLVAIKLTSKLDKYLSLNMEIKKILTTQEKFSNYWCRIGRLRTI